MKNKPYYYTCMLALLILLTNPLTNADEFYDVEIEQAAFGKSYIKVQIADNLEEMTGFINNTKVILANSAESFEIEAVITFKYPQLITTVMNLEANQLSVLSVLYIDAVNNYQEEPPVELLGATPDLPIEIGNQIIVGARMKALPSVLLAQYQSSIVAVVDPGPINMYTVQENQEMIMTKPVYQEYLAHVSKTSAHGATNSSLPTVFLLRENYPNPFNPQTEISFDIAKASEVNIIVYNVLGQKTKTIVSKYMTPGTYTVSWDGTDDSGSAVATGIYLLKMNAEGFSDSKKMLLLK